MLKVSVVVATYNRADLLGGCLDSIARQTYRELSLVEVNEHLYVKETREGTPQSQWARARAAGKG